MSLERKNAVIYGAGGATGSAVAEAFVQEGATVFLVGRTFAKLDTARSAYFEYFGNGLPGTSYDFYDPPREIEIEGSLFWDASHASGGRPGPQRLRPHMPVVWEIHPVTEIVFEP